MIVNKQETINLINRFQDLIEDFMQANCVPHPDFSKDYMVYLYKKNEHDMDTGLYFLESSSYSPITFRRTEWKDSTWFDIKIENADKWLLKLIKPTASGQRSKKTIVVEAKECVSTKIQIWKKQLIKKYKYCGYEILSKDGMIKHCMDKLDDHKNILMLYNEAKIALRWVQANRDKEAFKRFSRNNRISIHDVTDEMVEVQDQIEKIKKFGQYVELEMLCE